VQPQHARRWAAQLHGQGLSPRSMQLMLSAWRGLYRWLGREAPGRHNPVEGLRAPRAAKPLPKALVGRPVGALADFHAADSPPAIEARDHCLVELLYGCGLRVARWSGLDALASGTAQGWIDLDAAEAQVLGKGSKRRSCRSARPLRGLAPGWRSGLSWRRPGEPALFVSARGQRITAAIRCA
jgi:integrase/recombinase XerC